MHSAKNNTPPFSVINFIYNTSKKFRWHLLGMTTVMMGWAIDLTLRPYLTKWIFDTAMKGNSPEIIYQLSLLSAAFCITLGMIIGAFRLYDLVSLNMEISLRQYTSEKLMAYMLLHDHTFYQKQMSGSLTNKVNDVVRGIPQILKILIERFFTIAFSMIVIMSSMYYFHPLLAAVMGSWMAIFITGSLLIAAKSSKLTDEASRMHAIAVGSITDTFANIFSVRLFAGKNTENNILHAIFSKTAHAEYRRDILLAKIQAFQTVTYLLLEVICFAILIRDFAANKVTPGDFILVLNINLSLIWVLWGLVQDLTNFIKAWGEVSEGLRTLMLPHTMLDAPNAEPLVVSNGSIEFRNVSFSYRNNEPFFDNLSVTIPGGQKVGLVGYSGSGKSTFVNLILRLFDLDSGVIAIDNHDISLVTQDSLRSQIALIPQDPSLFQRSIRDNIAYGKSNALDTDIVTAAQHAHANLFIEKMDQQYDTLVGERGLTLSGGQRQRIAIARAFVKQAPILFLDEATSALDSITESYIQDSLWKLMEGRTTIVIAHRLSTLMHMDRILVFDKGRIIEDGTHTSLLAQQGLYHSLWQAQIGGFLPDKTAHL